MMPDDLLVAALERTGPDTMWRPAGGIDLDFDVFHPQGMAVTADRIYLSSVEVHEWPVRHPESYDSHDRTPGVGVGHLFVLDRQGSLLHDLVLGDGDRYHPGGLDVDGDALYVPLAEYRPDSTADVYRVDLDTLVATRLFTVDDHVGAVLRDRDGGHLVGWSWASRRWFEWDDDGRRIGTWPDPDGTLAHQDGQYLQRRTAVCSGVADDTGGLTLVDLTTRRVRHRLPIPLRTDRGEWLTRNPTHLDVEATDEGARLRLYAAPDDGRGTRVHVHTADVGGPTVPAAGPRRR